MQRRFEEALRAQEFDGDRKEWDAIMLEKTKSENLMRVSEAEF
jgi:hypothetical protein